MTPGVLMTSYSFYADDRAFVMNGLVLAPLSDDQVTSLNTYQRYGGDPVNCGADMHEPLVATTAGWTCPTCFYTSTVARADQANWSWARKGRS